MVLHEGLSVAVLIYVSETMARWKKERSTNIAVQRDKRMYWLGIRRKDRILSTQNRERGRVKKGEWVYEEIDGGSVFSGGLGILNE